MALLPDTEREAGEMLGHAQNQQDIGVPYGNVRASCEAKWSR